MFCNSVCLPCPKTPTIRKTHDSSDAQRNPTAIIPALQVRLVRAARSHVCPTSLYMRRAGCYCLQYSLIPELPGGRTLRYTVDLLVSAGPPVSFDIQVSVHAFSAQMHKDASLLPMSDILSCTMLTCSLTFASLAFTKASGMLGSTNSRFACLVWLCVVYCMLQHHVCLSYAAVMRCCLCGTIWHVSYLKCQV